MRRSDGRGEVNFGFICRVASPNLSLTLRSVKLMLSVQGGKKSDAGARS